MEQILSIHQVLLERSKAKKWPYMSSIIMRNKNVPLFEECFGQIDHDWLLKATKFRICKEISTCVIRYIDGNNLSLDLTYRKRDFYMGLLYIDGDYKTMKKWIASRARYHYTIGDCKMARFLFIRGTINWKTILYYITSFIKPIRIIIVKQFNVFG